MKKKVFISFDYDHDKGLKDLLVGQSENPDSPFEIADWSVKEPLSGDWQAKVREKMKKVDIVVVMCGKHTDTATGVNAEVRIAQEESLPYFLLAGPKDSGNKKPKAAKDKDKLYKWTWPNLKELIGGSR